LFCVWKWDVSMSFLDLSFCFPSLENSRERNPRDSSSLFKRISAAIMKVHRALKLMIFRNKSMAFVSALCTYWMFFEENRPQTLMKFSSWFKRQSELDAIQPCIFLHE
jgi:hypothetical protein